MALASALLSVLIAGVFAVLVGAITGMSEAAGLARRTEQVLAVANNLERLVIDLETGQRGFLITRDDTFLQPWTNARASFDGQAVELRRLATAHHPEQAERADRIAKDGQSYIRDYSEPLVSATRADPAFVPNATVSIEGKQRVDRIRGQFTRFVAFEHGLATQRDVRSDEAARRAVAVAVGGLAGSVVLIVGFSAYLTRGVVVPVRRTSVMAGEVARGDLGVRMPETGQAEIGDLQRSFNSMARSLKKNRNELAASRARVVAAGDAARSRIERDLHDGTQQRLVTLGLELRMLEADVPPAQQAVKQRLAWFVREMTEIIHELREFSRGIHPFLLTKGGLAPALMALARRSAVPVDIQLRLDRPLGERTDVALYYVVCEALTNAAKHAHASAAQVEVTTDDAQVRLSVWDDGVGGADPARGSGLIGLRDRVEALGGQIRVISPAGGGTTLLVLIPSPPEDGRSAAARDGAVEE